MKRWLVPIALLAVTLAGRGQDASPFQAYDVFIDAGDSALAVYQVEIRASKGALVTGVEGGVAPFAQAPYYDPAALQGGRIVIGAFTKNQNVPRGRVRVARLHMMEENGAATYTVKVIAAAGPDGEKTPAKIELARVGEKR
ncbi:MAG: hypothetical protein V3T86_15470 [Planctomycetota bacterium]